MNTVIKQWRDFKIGDIVRNNYTFRDKLFVIVGFGGNDYCPIVRVTEYGKPRENRYKCNFEANVLSLVDAARRPFSKLSMKALVALMKKGKVEAKREILMRTKNCKRNV